MRKKKFINIIQIAKDPLKAGLSLFLLILLLIPDVSFGQAIEGGEGWASPYIKSLSRVLLAGGGILGVFGAIKIYIKWNSGHQQIADDIMYWGGSCVALILISIFCNYLF